MLDEETRSLVLRAYGTVSRGAASDGHFYNEREQYLIGSHLDKNGLARRYVFYGGYEGAERKMLFALPDYCPDICDGLEEYVRSVQEDTFVSMIASLRITGSGYRELGHRDYLGSLLGLGLERFVIGDILVRSECSSAVFFCSRKISGFITEQLETVGADRISVSVVDDIRGFEPENRFVRVLGTVASNRADSVVSSLTGMSRDEAKKAISDGNVEVNYEKVIKAETDVAPGDTVSVRGKGKYIIRDISGTTRKGRIRLAADRYV